MSRVFGKDIDATAPTQTALDYTLVLKNSHCLAGYLTTDPKIGGYGSFRPGVVSFLTVKARDLPGKKVDCISRKAMTATVYCGSLGQALGASVNRVDRADKNLQAIFPRDF